MFSEALYDTLNRCNISTSGKEIPGNRYIICAKRRKEKKLAAFINNDGGTVNLKGGNWTMTALDNWQESLIPTFVDNNSNVNSATITGKETVVCRVCLLRTSA